MGDISPFEERIEQVLRKRQDVGQGADDERLEPAALSRI